MLFIRNILSGRRVVREEVEDVLGKQERDGLTTSLPQKEHSDLILCLSQHMSSKFDFNSCQLVLKLLFKRKKNQSTKYLKTKRYFCKIL